MNPPGTRQPLTTPGTPLAHSATLNKKSTTISSTGNILIRKRKVEDGSSPGNSLSSVDYKSGETKAKYNKTSATISSKFFRKYRGNGI